MKILTKEEEAAHYSATVKGGIGGGLAGLVVGLVGVYGASRRYPAFRGLTLPLKAFLVTSSGTFAAIISADKYSRAFEASRHRGDKYKDEAERTQQQLDAGKSLHQKAIEWGRENRYPIVGVSWVVSMAAAFSIVGRSPYLTTAQKLVQARVYAQGLTIAVMIATAAFEIGDKSKEQGRWETVQVLDPNDPTHQHLIEKRIHHESYAGEDMWRDMVEVEERKMNARKAAARKREVHKPKEDNNKGEYLDSNNGSKAGKDKTEKYTDSEKIS